MRGCHIFVPLNFILFSICVLDYLMNLLNLFIFQSEAPLMIRPFLKDMTKSELHAVCTGGFATIAGSVMAAYILMNVGYK